MRAEDLVFWLDVIVDGHRPERGVLCQRHADSMVVPRGGTLNDLREPHLHLFRPPTRPDVAKPRSRRRREAPMLDETAQLALGADFSDNSRIIDEYQPDSDTAPTTDSRTAGVSNEGSVELAETSFDRRDDDVTHDGSRWTPAFDDGDDLDGLLSARSPLLSRAFRVNDRPD
jgi:hypothetical protein